MGDAGGPWTIERAIRAARSEVGLPDDFRFHDLRHYFGSLLIASGLDVKVVQARLRHASAKTTLDTYGHLWPDRDDTSRAAVAAVYKERTLEKRILRVACSRIDGVTADDEHAELTATWVRLREVIDDLPRLLQWGDVQYMDVTDMAERVRGLAMHLDSAVLLADKFRYDSALVLVRTGLEQCVLDWLVFQGRTLVQRYSGVDEEKWEEWQTARTDGAEWTTTIRDWTRTRRGDVRIVREGLYSEPDKDGNRRQISLYYFLLEQYRPTLGPPSAQVDDWAISNDELRRMAQENESMWRVYLTWSSLLTNLQENELVDDIDAGRLATHYRFLSGYAHPVVDHRRETYGRDALLGWPRYDHYSSELVLLYAITLGVLELRNFIRSLDQRPAPTLARSDEVEQVLAATQSTTSYFWVLGANPHPYDTWKARNEVAFRAMRDGIRAELLPEPTPGEVPYPSDPLRRLVALHGSAQEMMTGLVYVSPWPRADAQFR